MIMPECNNCDLVYCCALDKALELLGQSATLDEAKTKITAHKETLNG
jgi:hypothetical protein